MNYFFYTTTVSNHKIYLIESSESKILENFGGHRWTAAEIQQTIDNIISARKNGKEYRWANEDVHLVAYQDEIFLFNLVAARAGDANKNQDFTMAYEEFITFLKDFKKFVEKN